MKSASVVTIVSEGSSLQDGGRKQRVHIYMFLKREDLPLLGVAAGCAMLMAASTSAFSVLTGRVFAILSKLSANEYDSFSEFVRHLRLMCGYIMVVGGATFAVGWLNLSCWMELGERQQLRMRRNLFYSFFDKPVAWFELNPELNGDIVQANRCIEELRSAVSESTGLIVQSAGSVVALVVTSFLYNWRLSLIILTVFPLLSVSVWILNTKVQFYSERENYFSAEAAKTLELTLGNPQFVKAFNAQRLETSRFNESLGLSRMAFNRFVLFTSLNSASMRLLVLTVFVAAFWYGFHLVQTGLATGANVITTFLSCLLLTDVFHIISEQLSHLQRASVALEKLLKFAAPKESAFVVQSQNANKVYPGNCSGAISFQNVDFSYPSRPELVLQDCSLEIAPKRLTFIVGKSGSGKSTLASLLLDFYHPRSGNVLIDGVDVAELDSLWLTDNITVLTQSTQLFSESIRTNIGLAISSKQPVDTLSDLQIEDALEFSTLQQLIWDLPDGLDTRLGEKGKSLSGGQQQKVALARAKLRDTPILILDETLSALDVVHKNLIMAAIRKWRQGKTTIIMIHDYSQINDDDHVIVLDAGQEKEEGLKADLTVTFSENSQEIESTVSEDPFEVKFELLADDTDKEEAQVAERVTTFPDGLPGARNRRQEPVKCNSVDEDQETRPETLLSVWQTLWKFKDHLNKRSVIVVGIVCSVLNGAANPAFSYSFSKLLAAITLEDDIPKGHYVMKWSLIVLGISVADALTLFVKKLCLGLAAEVWINSIRSSAFDFISEQDLGWFQKELHKSNELSALLMNDTRDLRGLVSEFLDVIFTSVVLVTMGVIWSVVVGWKLSLVGVSFIPLFILVTGLFSSLLQRRENLYKSEVAGLENFQQETISGVMAIRCFRLNSFFFKRFQKAETDLRRSGLLRAIAFGFWVGLTSLIMYISRGVVLYYGVYLVAKSEYTVYQLMEVMTLIIFSVSSASGLIMQIPGISKARRAATYLLRLFGSSTETSENGHRCKAVRLDNERAVEFSSTSFKYPGRDRLVLNDVSFYVNRKEVFGIIGESGSGKSTISALMMGFYQSSGVRIWGADVGDIDTQFLRSKIAVVFQEATFIDGSIKRNLVYGLEQEPSGAEIEGALKCAQIYDFVSSLPQGLETVIGGEMTSLLSGGQAQRLSIARALLRDPEILVLDESTSALDPQTSAQIRGIIDTSIRARGVTVIVITHDPEMMKITDRLVVLKDGSVAAIGRYEDLNPGRAGPCTVSI